MKVKRPLNTYENVRSNKLLWVFTLSVIAVLGAIGLQNGFVSEEITQADEECHIADLSCDGDINSIDLIMFEDIVGGKLKRYNPQIEEEFDYNQNGELDEGDAKRFREAYMI